MKKKSKITGEIDEIDIIEISIPKDKIIAVVTHQDGVQCKFTYSRRTFNEEWEDVPEEPKEYYCITGRGNLHYLQDITDGIDKDHKEIGNYFETKEEAEKAVEKLKAWKRLKDKGFRFNCWDGYVSAGDFDSGDHFECCGFVNAHGNFDSCEDDYSKCKTDLDLLFGGEE